MTTHISSLRQRIVESAAEILPRVLGRAIPGLTDATKLMDELGLRSATTLELLLELEDALEIQIDVEEIDQADVTTLGDLADYVAGHSIAG